MFRRLLSLICFATFVLSMKMCFASTQYRIRDLGSYLCEAYDINGRGQIVGQAYRGQYRHAVLLDNETVFDLGTFGLDSSAEAINNNREVVGYSRLPNGDYRAFLWKDGVMSNLATLGGKESFARDINNNGQIVGMSCYSACVWQDGIIRALPSLGGTDSSVLGINQNGQMVGYSWTPSYYTHAISWEDNTLDDLRPGSLNSRAEAINDNGVVAGYYWIRGKPIASIWQNDVMQSLGTFGGTFSYAVDINNNGQVVGWSQTTDGHENAYVWQNGMMSKLDIFDGCTYYHANAINELGYIVGSAYINNSFHAVLWEPVPEQSSIMTLLCGISGIGGMMWRRRK